MQKDASAAYRRVELIHGEVHEWALEGNRHICTVDRLITRVVEATQQNAIMRVQSMLQLGPDSAVQPDICLLHRRDEYYQSEWPTANDVLLVIEVAESSVEFDRQTKAALYAQYNIPDFWLLDLGRSRTIRFRHPVNGRYADILSLSTGVSLRVHDLPSTQINLDGVFH